MLLISSDGRASRGDAQSRLSTVLIASGRALPRGFNFTVAGESAAGGPPAYAVHEIFATSLITDGSFARDVYVPAGGSVRPPTAETIERRMHFFDAPNPESMKTRLDPIFLERFVEVIGNAVRASGFSMDEIGFLASQRMKRSLFRALLEQLDLDESRSFYLEDFGHMSATDPFVALSEADRRGLLKTGDLIVAVAVSLGCTWAATALRW